MPLAEVLTIEVGSAIAKSILKLWLRDHDIATDISFSLVDVLKLKISDKLAQQRARRQFETIGEKVGESLFPIFEAEGCRLDGESGTAVALAVSYALNKANFSSELLAERNLDPSKLAKYVLGGYPEARLLNEKEQSLYQRIITESCTYIVDVASQLPSFTEHTLAEVLKRESFILDIAEQVLKEVRRMRDQLDPKAYAAQFEINYRRAVVRNLDELELFGVDVATASRRHRLSVAYVTLSVTQKILSTLKSGKVDLVADNNSPRGPQHEVRRSIVNVDEALADSSRLLVRGSAGSGKTTLLQWIAVRSASQTFTGRLAQWNETVPFYIRLRQCIQSGRLPYPETFPRLVSPALAGSEPKGWVKDKLESGRAIVLVDGVDEVPSIQRQDVYKWLKDLADTYPKSRFIVTSRPHAVDGDWTDSISFKNADLQPMELQDIYTFIDHWHAAVLEQLSDSEEGEELVSLAEHLKLELEHDRSKRDLATSPLMCAMLCALNRERRQQLPSDRIELYEACCYLLIERRDRERRVDLSDYPNLTYRQKRLLLEDLAYWMVRNGLSELKRSSIEERLDYKLENIQNISKEVTGAKVRKLFVERSGIIREPIEGLIDFTHRTFQEFLTAKAVLDEGDLGVLMQNAHNDQWREVIILAAGLASSHLCEEIISTLIAKGDNLADQRYQLHLLAVSCLQTPVELKKELIEAVTKRLSNLVPPKEMQDATALASAGDMAVPYLLNEKLYPVLTISTCIHALALIHSDLALEALETYTDDTRPQVIDELFWAWSYFDRDKYARLVLLPALRNSNRCELDLTHISSLDGFQHFINLTSLSLSECEYISDLSPLANLTQLTSLRLSSCQRVVDLSPLTKLTQLTNLRLPSCQELRDLSPLANLKQLTHLSLSYCRSVRNLSILTELVNLKELHLTGIYHLVTVPPQLRGRVSIIH